VKNRRQELHSVARGGEKTGAMLIPAFVVASIVLGGASAPGEVLPFVLQVLSALVLVIVAIRPRATAPAPTALLWAGMAVLALVLVHLMPLPPELWMSLPGHAAIAEQAAIAGLQPGWLPLSLNPSSTAASLAAALPAMALVALALTSPRLPIRQTAVAIVGSALVAWFLAALQFLGGGQKLLHLHAYANWGMGTGFFANANHMGTLLALSVPVATALATTMIARSRRDPRLALAVVVAVSGVAAIGISLTNSVAGIVLLPLATIGSLCLVPTSLKYRAFATGGALAAAVLGVVASSAILGTSLEDSAIHRPGIWRNTMTGILQSWPFGSGLGTFPEVYPLFENADSVVSTYVNHAHNDYLEVVFEAGLIGAGLVVLGLATWVVLSLRAWRGRVEDELWPRTASIVIGIVLAHSIVDYPLRTPAILVITTFFALVLASPQRSPATNAQR
jgi:O-antigen ligase